MNYSLIFQNKKKHGKNRLLLNYTSKFYYSSQETLCYGNYIYTQYMKRQLSLKLFLDSIISIMRLRIYRDDR